MSGPAVEVNECAILATCRGADWWIAWRQQMEPAGRITVLTASLGGDRLSVACDSTEDAQWLAGHMTGFAGIPQSAVKVKRGRRL